MKHLFVPSLDGAYVSKLDASRGTLLALADTVVVQPESSLVDPANFELYQEPVEPVVVPVPPSVSNWRAKAVLAMAGLLPAVEAALDALDEPQRTVALAAWNGNADFERHGTTVTTLAPALNLSDEQVDDLFRQADALQV